MGTRMVTDFEPEFMQLTDIFPRNVALLVRVIFVTEPFGDIEGSSESIFRQLGSDKRNIRLVAIVKRQYDKAVRNGSQSGF